MKRLILAVGAGLLALAMAGPSSAADLPRPAYKAPAYVAAPFSWSGFYVGLNAGYGWGTSSWSAGGVSTGDFDAKGWLGGGTIGYNLQTGVWVWGLEADLDYSTIKGTDGTGCCETRNTWLGTARGRIGYAFDRWLPYITGGAAFGGIKMTPALGADESKTKIGWTAGAGLEYAFLGAWSAKIEYLYADLGTSSCDCGGVPIDVKFKTNIIRAGVNYRF